MARIPDEISLCHFADITRNPFNDYEPPEASWHYCSFCGKEARETLFIPHVLPGDDLELTIRRFKDGAIQYDEVAEAIERAINKPLQKFTKVVEESLTKGAYPKWRLNFATHSWEKLKTVRRNNE